MRRSGRLPDLVRPEPICSPIGVMARSAPRLKSAMPIISTRDETRNTISSVFVRLTSGVKYSIATISDTGRTDISASRSLTPSAFAKRNAPLYFVFMAKFCFTHYYNNIIF